MMPTAPARRDPSHDPFQLACFPDFRDLLMPLTPKVTKETVARLRHEEKRINNPTAELAPRYEQQAEKRGYERTL